MVPTTILHIPHSATFIPADVRSSLVLDDDELRVELLAMTDRYTDELFGFPPSAAIAARYAFSRLVVDPERFLDDADEAMTRVGMGAVYERTSRGAILRRPPSADERADLLTRFYRPHHELLDRTVTAVLGAHGRCLIVDCHSFPSTPHPYEADQSEARPDVCIGTDALHTPPSLRDAAIAAFAAQGMSVEVDRPFSGTIVSAAHYRRDPRVHSVMIEVNRRLYMDEMTGLRHARFDAVRTVISETLREVIEAAARG